jgi:hypothetical protein
MGNVEVRFGLVDSSLKYCTLREIFDFNIG